MLPASQLSGAIPSANLAGTYSSAVTFNKAANSFTGNGTGLTALGAGQLTSGTVPDGRLAGNVARTNQVWLLGGNAGTSPGTHFLGTKDNQPLEFRVNGQRALRLEPARGNSVNVIGGYSGNYLSGEVVGATIGGGGAGPYLYGQNWPNQVLRDFGTVGGGGDNTAAGAYATVGGGHKNTVVGDYATIPGGDLNAATHYAFAAGRRAKANHTGAFVWGDSTDADIASTTANSVTMRASGGYRLFSDTNATTGVYLAAGGGSWSSISDRNAKENFAPVNVREVLEKVVALPVTTWNYKSQDASIRHIGPMAQDFRAAFGVGETDTGITSIDPTAWPWRPSKG